MAVSWVPEDAVRKAVAAAAKVCLLSPRESWSADFLIEYIISELSLISSSQAAPPPAQLTSGSGSMAADQHTTPTQTAAAAAAAAPAGTEGTLLPLTSAAVAAVVGQAPPAGPDTSGSTQPKRGAAAAGSQLSDIIVEYYEADPSDVADFQEDLSRRLQQLVSEHTAAGTDSEEELGEGACRLCGRIMPLTKHHLVPREVHKDFRKRGWTREQLAEGVAVCRPCHSAIHKAVPDNKELGTAYHTLEALQQHERIAKFAAWAAKQRTPSAADVRHNPNFRYQR